MAAEYTECDLPYSIGDKNKNYKPVLLPTQDGPREEDQCPDEHKSGAIAKILVQMETSGMAIPAKHENNQETNVQFFTFNLHTHKTFTRTKNSAQTRIYFLIKRFL
ncbi:hypothetical protein RRG08_006459 [Elysia crispata]|uniref:Uncharacterized protein n=1 Tax=Elysia crispata TaxID=231223 RepID=A0AAE0YBM7_9GAST|nr:hypothetical protein RRG08_006459 [Elysia crispata]